MPRQVLKEVPVCRCWTVVVEAQWLTTSFVKVALEQMNQARRLADSRSSMLLKGEKLEKSRASS